MSVNSVNQILMVMVYFWISFLVIISAVMVLIRIATLLSASIRLRILVVKKSKTFVTKMVLTGATTPSHLSCLDKIGDWFLLTLICQNLNMYKAQELIRAIYFKEKNGNQVV